MHHGGVCGGDDVFVRAESARDVEGGVVEREGARRASETVSGELVEEDDAREIAVGSGGPRGVVVERAGRGRLDGGDEGMHAASALVPAYHRDRDLVFMYSPSLMRSGVSPKYASSPNQNDNTSRGVLTEADDASAGGKTTSHASRMRFSGVSGERCARVEERRRACVRALEWRGSGELLPFRQLLQSHITPSRFRLTRTITRRRGARVRSPAG